MYYHQRNISTQCLYSCSNMTFFWPFTAPIVPLHVAGTAALQCVQVFGWARLGSHVASPKTKSPGAAGLNLILSCTKTHIHTPMHTQPFWYCWHTQTQGALPARPFTSSPILFSKEEPFVNSGVCTPSTACANFKGPACLPAHSTAAMVQGDRVSGLKALRHLVIIQTSPSSNDVFYICCGG